MTYLIKENNSIFLECPTCNELTDHYPVHYANSTYLECEVCILSAE
jgi:translation initiation factor 2 beta subunit (eIF-2beta)/eIF-5